MSYLHTGLLCIKGLLLLFAALSLPACTGEPSAQRQTLYVFGTLVEITAFTDDAAAFQQSVNHLDRRFQKMHRDWHAWEGDGELVELNRALARGETFSVGRELAELLQRGVNYFEQSDGLFNPALGQLIGLWGFHQDELPQGAPPSAERISSLVAAQPGMSDLRIKDARVSSSNRLCGDRPGGIR